MIFIGLAEKNCRMSRFSHLSLHMTKDRRSILFKYACIALNIARYLYINIIYIDTNAAVDVQYEYLLNVI